ncbi:Rap1-interacting factor 1 N terminal-domain-containing protein [Geopyxis carbonaria]|nr:Rap1-interacting factor 1 N terminal-domain-containing protein [Geopyxis carbonaria]
MVQVEFEDSPSEIDSEQVQEDPRPPTPPRESPRSVGRPLEGEVLNDGSIKLPAQLPPSSPREPSPPSSSAESGSSKPKSVTWSAWTTYHKPESPFPPRNSTPKSIKSILKPFSPSSVLSSPTPGGNYPIIAHTHASFISMLESILQALDSQERSQKLDAYITFCNVLKAYDEVPDVGALQAKIPRLAQFIKRDLHAQLAEGGNADSQLAQCAIKLMTIICWTPYMVTCLDEQMSLYFMENAMRKIEDPATSKVAVNLYLHFLTQQKFSIKIMTQERCNKIVASLQTLDDRVTGKSISKERIDLYIKVLSVSKMVMLSRVEGWMEHAWGGLLSGVKEVRTHALMLMSEATKAIGGEKAVASAITDIFDRQVPTGGKMFEHIRHRLDHFVRMDGEGAYVSRMWAIVLLLVQGKDQWTFFNPWLRVIETCFNVSDKDVKVEAQVAWSKLIYAMDIDHKTPKRLLTLLAKPVGQYLDPMHHMSNTRKPRKAAMVNVAVMLYYGFRPACGPRWLDIWDVVIVGLVENLALQSREEVPDGCHILCAIFDGSTHKIWNEQRILVGQTIKADEIPRLDPRWVRTNCAKLLSTIEVGLAQSSWQEMNGPGARLLWKRFTKTLADAGSKEIKISAELMEAVSHIFNMFQRIWNTGPAFFDKSQYKGTISFMAMFSFLVETALESLGTFCFTEKQLGYDEESRYVPAPTPSNKFGVDSNSSLRYAPILHIFRLLMAPPKDVPVDAEYLDCAKRILSKCNTSQDSRRKRLQLLASYEGLLPRRGASETDLALWNIISDLTCKALPSPSREKALLSPVPATGEFKDAVGILKWGSQLNVTGWQQLFDELIRVIHNELGESAVILNVIEPIAESLRYIKPNVDLSTVLTRTMVVFEKANYSKTRPKMENTFRMHFGLAERKATNAESFENLFALGSTMLQTSYNKDNAREILSVGLNLFSAISDFISRAPQGSIAPLKQMQEGLGMWARDEQHLISKKNDLNALIATTIWTKVLRAVETLPKHDSVVLSHLSTLLSCGFESIRKDTANATIKTWNATFGKQTAITYPKRVRLGLSRLRSVADISLPSFPENDDSFIATPPVFEDSQEADDLRSVENIFSSPTPRPARRMQSVEASPRPSAIVKETPYLVRSRKSMTPAKQPPPKLPHMDSQIDFVPVENTPEFETQDSQLVTEHQKETRERQAQTANIFSDLAAVTPTRRSRRNMVLSPEKHDQKPIKTEDAGPADVLVPQTTVKENPSAVMVSFVSETSMNDSRAAFPATPSFVGSVELYGDRPDEPMELATQVDPPELSEGLEREPELPPPVPLTEQKLDPEPMSEDVDMLTPEPDEIPSESEVIAKLVDAREKSTGPEEPFVDAKEVVEQSSHRTQHTATEYENISPLMDIADLVGNSGHSPISVQINPVKNMDQYETTDTESHVSYSGPEAQIIQEVISAGGTPLRARKKPPPRSASKRKRVSSGPKEVNKSPEMLDTIVVDVDAVDVIPATLPRPLVKMPSLSPDELAAPPSKRAKPISIIKTPVSAVKTRSTRKNTRAMVLPDYEDELSMDVSVSPTPTPTKSRLNLQPRRTRSSLGVVSAPEMDVSFVQETQMSDIDSEIADSQTTPQPSRVEATPTRSSRKVRGLFSVKGKEKKQEQPPEEATPPVPTESAPVPIKVPASEARLTRRRAALSKTPIKTPVKVKQDPEPPQEAAASAKPPALKTAQPPPPTPAKDPSPEPAKDPTPPPAPAPEPERQSSTQPNSHPFNSDQLARISAAAEVYGLPRTTDTHSLDRLRIKSHLKLHDAPRVLAWVEAQHAAANNPPPTPAEKATFALREAIRMIEEAGLTKAEIEKLEDECFSGYSKIRKRRQDM